MARLDLLTGYEASMTVWTASIWKMLILSETRKSGKSTFLHKNNLAEFQPAGPGIEIAEIVPHKADGPIMYGRRFLKRKLHMGLTS